jgi:uncharacterized damage-inducible protein DinB
MTNSVERLFETFNIETWLTRKILAVIPQDKLDWRPHEKSMALGMLAEHTSKMLILARYVLQNPELDVSRTPPPHMNLELTSVKDILKEFDTLTDECRTLIEDMTELDANHRWSFRMGEKVFLKQLRPDAINMAVLLHMSHHRGQISVYLRLLDIPVPPLYGPSADASWDDFLAGLP